MAVTVIVEDGSGVASSNSYVSIVTITDWVLTNPHDSTWAALTDAQKNGYAVMACRVLNEQMDWDGWQTDADQSLDLPRSGMTDKNGNSIDNNEIPFEVQNAQCELARLLAIADRTADPDTAGYKEITVGPIKVIADKTDRPAVMADAVWNMISPFGSKSISKGVSRTYRA
jgi:hypothetical protein